MLYIQESTGRYRPATFPEVQQHAEKELYARTFRGVAKFSGPDSVNEFLTCSMGHLEREEFRVLLLDNQHALLEVETLSIGTINSANVYPREVVKAALRHNAAAVILAHNHPSGDVEPSQADRSITARLQQALAMVEVVVLDHFVVGGNRVVSFAQRGLI